MGGFQEFYLAFLPCTKRPVSALQLADKGPRAGNDNVSGTDRHSLGFVSGRRAELPTNPQPFVPWVNGYQAIAFWIRIPQATKERDLLKALKRALSPERLVPEHAERKLLQVHGLPLCYMRGFQKNLFQGLCDK